MENLLMKSRKARKAIEDIRKEERAARAEKTQAKRAVTDDYYDRIRTLENKRDNVLEAIQKKYDEFAKVLDAQIEEESVVVKKVDRLFELMTVAKSEAESPTDLKPAVYHYTDRDERGNYLGWNNRRRVYYPSIGVVMDSPYQRIEAFIVDTGKPVNKYALVLFGVTIFAQMGKLKLEIPYAYGLKCHSDSSMSMTLKEAPDKKSLELWYQKNGAKKIDEYLSKHKEFEQEYERAKELLKQKQWQVAHLEHLKDYYEHGYHRGTETDEYKVVMKELKKLRGGKK